MQFFKNIDICTNCVLQEEKIDAIYSLDMDIIFSFMTAQCLPLRCHPAIKSGDCSRKKKKKKKKITLLTQLPVFASTCMYSILTLS